MVKKHVIIYKNWDNSHTYAQYQGSSESLVCYDLETTIKKTHIITNIWGYRYTVLYRPEGRRFQEPTCLVWYNTVLLYYYKLYCTVLLVLLIHSFNKRQKCVIHNLQRARSTSHWNGILDHWKGDWLVVECKLSAYSAQKKELWPIFLTGHPLQTLRIKCPIFWLALSSCPLAWGW